MEVYQLRSFVAVAEELHVSRAAARLHLAQPTLSRQIAALERTVGVPLFRRTQRRLQLTSAGEALPAAHPLATRHRVPPAALAHEPFVLYPREPGSTGHDTIIEHCRQAGYQPRIIQEATDAQTVVALVAAGLGLSLLLTPPRRSTRRWWSTASFTTTSRSGRWHSRGGKTTPRSRWPGSSPSPQRPAPGDLAT